MRLYVQLLKALLLQGDLSYPSQHRPPLPFDKVLHRALAKKLTVLIYPILENFTYIWCHLVRHDLFHDMPA